MEGETLRRRQAPQHQAQVADPRGPTRAPREPARTARRPRSPPPTHAANPLTTEIAPLLREPPSGRTSSKSVYCSPISRRASASRRPRSRSIARFVEPACQRASSRASCSTQSPVCAVTADELSGQHGGAGTFRLMSAVGTSTIPGFGRLPTSALVTSGMWIAITNWRCAFDQHRGRLVADALGYRLKLNSFGLAHCRPPSP